MKSIHKVMITILLGVFMLLVAGELFSRLYLGLGDPPLCIADQEIDYLFAPNQDCNRFGNRILYNNVSMRSDFNVVNGEGGGGSCLL